MDIDGIPASAPLFKGASKDELASIIKHLHDASYHYADDSAKEWEAANGHIRNAGGIANKCRLSFRAMQAIQKEAKPLTPLDDLIDAAISAARNEK